MPFAVNISELYEVPCRLISRMSSKPAKKDNKMRIRAFPVSRFSNQFVCDSVAIYNFFLAGKL